MTHNASGPSDETLAALLAAFDEAIARGASREEALESVRRRNAAWAAYLESVESVFGLIEQAYRNGTPPEQSDTPTVTFQATGPYIPAESGATPPKVIVNTGKPAPALPAVPGYEVLAVLGKGGMGIVYKARQVSLKRIVALKMIRGGRAGPDELARFRTEAEALARLQHPNIVQVYEVGLHDGQPYFSLEYVEGGSLDKKLGGEPRPARQSAEVVDVLARAIHAAHEANIIHRDLKPANVLVGPGWVLKVTDFGLAKQIDADSGQTQTGQVMGTPSYMAPEQAAGRVEAIGPAADVYALGAILYECLTGRPPFKGATVLDTLEQVRSQEPVAPRALNPQAPRDLETVCLMCLQKEAGKRYASAAMLADDLGRFLRGEPILARPVGTRERAFKWVRRNPVPASLIGVLILGLLGTSVSAGVAVSQRNRAREAENEVQAARTRDHDREEAARTQEHDRLLRSYEEAAQLAARQGAWKEALLFYGQAIAEGHPEGVKLRLGKVRAWLALGNSQEARRELEELTAEPDLGQYAAQVDLHRGELLLGTDEVGGEMLIRDALAGELPPADRLYARAMVEAQTPQQALDLCLDAIKQDRFHRDAFGTTISLLVLLGRLDEGRDLALQGEALFPESQEIQFDFYALAMLRRNRAEMASRRKRLDGEFGSMADLIGELFEALPLDAPPSGIRSGSPLPLPDLLKFMRVANKIGGLNLAPGKAPGEALRVALPLCMKRGLTVSAADLMRLLAPWSAPDKELVEKFGPMVETYPEGVLAMFYARLLFNYARHNYSRMASDEATYMTWLRKAACAAELATTRPMVVPVRTWAMDDLIVMEWELGSPERAKPDLEMRARALAHVKERLTMPPTVRRAEYLSLFFEITSTAGDKDLARFLLAEWERQSPKDGKTLKPRAILELESGNYGRAVEAAQKALEKKKDDPRLKEILLKATEKLREEARKYEDLPR